jgi:hypothetical protein
VRATFTLNGRDVGVLIMSRDGDYEWDLFDEERDRFEGAITKIIEDLREPSAWVGRGGKLEPVIHKPGDPLWFDKVLARLQNEGYEHVVLADDS